MPPLSKLLLHLSLCERWVVWQIRCLLNLGCEFYFRKVLKTQINRLLALWIVRSRSFWCEANFKFRLGHVDLQRKSFGPWISQLGVYFLWFSAFWLLIIFYNYLLGLTVNVVVIFFLKKSGHACVHALEVDLRYLVVTHVFNIEWSDRHLLWSLFSRYECLRLSIFFWLYYRLLNRLSPFAFKRIFYLLITWSWHYWIDLDWVAFSGTSRYWFLVRW